MNLTSTSFTCHSSLSTFSGEYEAFILDIWGVIHDGQSLYPRAKETLETLRSLGKKIIFLSNAPKRAFLSKERFQELGIEDYLYDGIVTSGEILFHYLQANIKPHHSYYLLGSKLDRLLMEESCFSETKKIAEADFILAVGFSDEHSPLDEYNSLMQEALTRQIPMYCANPDKIIVRQDGSRMYCAGVLAKYYQSLGGKVTMIGKPYPEVYDQSLQQLEKLGIHTKQSIVAIGDNLETDIKGASNAGIDSVLITGGIYAQHFNKPYAILPDKHAIQSLCAKHETYPDKILPCFLYC